MRSTFIVAVCLLALAPAVTAQAPAGCADDRSRQFDFWIGEWVVEAGGKIAGTNSIRPILDGCVLQENWLGAGGSAGSSFNFYNPQKGRWEQFWVWRNGTTLELEGQLEDGNMILSGTTVGEDGGTVRHRVAWYDKPDGTVRQWWETSTDGGATWSSEAEIDAKPELEIYTDDVKCSHGTTVGQLDKTALFYLRSRGLPEGEASDLLVLAFVAEAIDEIEDERRGERRVAAERSAAAAWRSAYRHRDTVDHR